MNGTEITCTLATITRVHTAEEGVCASLCACCQAVCKNQGKNRLHYRASP